MSLVAVPLPDGRWLALAPEALREALAGAKSLGLGTVNAAAQSFPSVSQEEWLSSEQLQKVTGIHSTTWEAKAKSGDVPCLRVGKLLRFKLSEVETALKGGT